MPELSTAPNDASISGSEALLTLAFENVTVQQVADANESKATNIASAATTDIGAATAPFVHVTGTTTITALGTVQAGTRRIVVFDGILTLTHNGTSLILPTGANITTAAGDVAVMVSEGSGNWRCVGYMRASGQSLVSAASRNTASALSTSGSVAIDYALGDYFTLALAGNVTALTFSNLPGSGKGATLMIRITQDSTPRTVAWPASFKWAGGVAGVVSTGSGAVDVLAITTFDNGTTWDATLAKAFA